ncbi:hypothetical protein CFP65_1101 [Kitasatospora sp. MMS16-BH015]|nr:hypothetical protein CFP65_1101 [Kitasatospora sp. MMS16-BH015]
MDFADPGPVTAEDLAEGVRLVVDLLRSPAALAADWDAPAGPLEWSCWETAEHLADDLFSYAAQLGPQAPPAPSHVPFVWRREAPGKPANVIFAERAGGPEAMAQVLDACGALHVAMVRTAAPQARAFHIFGTTDAEGSASMGLVELFAHADDLARGLGLAWTPPAEVCARVLARLFPEFPIGTDPWATLRWATGRGGLPGRARRTRWQWDSAPRSEQLRIVRVTPKGPLTDWQHVHNTIIPTHQLSLEEIRDRAARNRLFTAYLGDTLVGCSTVRPPDEETPAATVIARILPDHRRRGLGTRLHRHARTEAADLAPTVETCVLATNEDGLAFALAAGYQETERYLLPGDTIPYITLTQP